MALRLEIISEHRELVGDDAVREFDEDGGTIGRSLKSDWILPDPDKYISSRHAVIDHKGGIYYIVDLSSNGTFVNDEYEPIGKGNPRRLFNGDRLRMGDFEIRISIDHGESIAMPVESDPKEIMQDNVERLVPEDSIHTGMTLLDEDELTGNEEFKPTLFSGAETLSESDIVTDVPDEIIDEPKPAPVQQAARPAPPPAVSEEAFDAFLEALGVDRSDLHPSVSATDVMTNAGEVFRELIDGLTRLLASRRTLKEAFSLDQTSVLPRHNNPLKLSQSARDSIMQLLVGHEGEYLGPRDAAREVCNDLLHHQDVVLEAMAEAFGDFTDRFDPDELEQMFRHDVTSIPMLGFLARAKFWLRYRDLYPIMTEKSDGMFPQTLAEGFVAAYERMIGEARRLDRPESLGETVRYEPKSNAEPEPLPSAVELTDAMQAELEEALSEQNTTVNEVIDDLDARDATLDSDVFDTNFDDAANDNN